jgi:hypothetical protein
MSNKYDIENCDNIEELKRLCLEYRKQLSVVSEYLIDVTKFHITTDEAVRKIREYLVENQSKLEVKQGCEYSDDRLFLLYLRYISKYLKNKSNDKEEVRKAINKYIDEHSKSTGINFDYFVIDEFIDGE